MRLPSGLSKVFNPDICWRRGVDQADSGQIWGPLVLSCPGHVWMTACCVCCSITKARVKKVTLACLVLKSLNGQNSYRTDFRSKVDNKGDPELPLSPPCVCSGSPALLWPSWPLAGVGDFLPCSLHAGSSEAMDFLGWWGWDSSPLPVPPFPQSWS